MKLQLYVVSINPLNSIDDFHVYCFYVQERNLRFANEFTWRF